MSEANPLWGAPRIHGELRKLGIDVGQASVAKYMVRRRQPRSQTWRTFLKNHMGQLMAADCFVVPTATCRLLFVLVILAHDRRRVVHVAVTAHSTAPWTTQQLREAFPWDEAPRFLLRDRDHAFDGLSGAAKTMGIHDALTAPRSPWQNAYVERFIGSVRRECLDHIIVLSAAGLRRVLKGYVEHYMASRTHLALEKDAPVSRPVAPPTAGRVVPIPVVSISIIATTVAPRSLAAPGYRQLRRPSGQPGKRRLHNDDGQASGLLRSSPAANITPDPPAILNHGCERSCARFTHEGRDGVFSRHGWQEMPQVAAAAVAA
jgi:transposase InsO family protein